MSRFHSALLRGVAPRSGNTPSHIALAQALLAAAALFAAAATGCRSAPLEDTEPPAAAAATTAAPHDAAAPGAALPALAREPLFEEIGVPSPAVAEARLERAEELEAAAAASAAVEVKWGAGRDPGAERAAAARSGATTTGSAAAVVPAAPANESGARARAGGELERRMEELLRELAAFEGKADADLAQAERFQKQRIQMQLIALHFLLPRAAQSVYLQPLLRSLEGAGGSGAKAHLLMVASFYHDLDLAELRDAALARLDGGAPPAVPAPASTGSLALRSLQVCKRIGGFRDFDPAPRGAVRAGDKFKLYGELANLQPRIERDVYEFRVEATARVYRDGGAEVRRLALSRPGGDLLARDSAQSEHYLCYEFTVPVGLDPGAYRLAVEVGDLHGKQTATAEIPLEIRAR
ncbi:MAG: hypothetical protein L0Z55_01235 [Planctomycetes bacterium]|nr:hypothetical protein [Planctomycetota bacterium]